MRWPAPGSGPSRAPRWRTTCFVPRPSTRSPAASSSRSLGGTTPKFDCALDSGETIRVKYGSGSEIPSEAAATRLVRALGFAADTITLVKRLRCHGCPIEPFTTLKTAAAVHAGELYSKAIDYAEHRDFEWVAVERKYDGEPIETATQQGWSFHELEQVRCVEGRGAARAHVDALRLMAAFLAHWDNKADNQRLVCVSREWPAGAPCPEPMLVLQDLGAAFGPRKVDLDGWSRTGIWGDRTTCRLSMRGLPYDGATFSDVRIGEPGRQLFAQPAAAGVRGAGGGSVRGRALRSEARPVQRRPPGGRLGARLQDAGRDDQRRPAVPSAVMREPRAAAGPRATACPRRWSARSARSPGSAGRRLRSPPA